MWIFNPYSDLYVAVPKERAIISFDSGFRFLKDSSWRKGADDFEMYSPASGAFFRFKSEQDLSLFANGFVPVRISIVVKESDEFFEKLVLLTSKTQMILAKPMNRVFNRNCAIASERRNTLVLALSAKDNPTMNICVLPKIGDARHYRLCYNNATKMIDIPSGLLFDGSASTDVYGSDHTAPINAQLEDQSNIGAQSLQLINIEYGKRMSNIATVHSSNDDNNPDRNCLVRIFRS